MITFKALPESREVVATCRACPQRVTGDAPPDPNHLSALLEHLVAILHANGCDHQAYVPVHQPRPSQGATYTLKYE